MPRRVGEVVAQVGKNRIARIARTCRDEHVGGRAQRGRDVAAGPDDRLHALAPQAHPPSRRCASSR